MTLIRSIVIIARSSSGKVNPLRVGLLSKSLPRSDLLSLYGSHQWA
uniref:Uncharacterized protein n=1 Tax=Arundo donax TaxID=35708 RepID=A0A0A9FFK3_ARUDO